MKPRFVLLAICQLAAVCLMAQRGETGGTDEIQSIEKKDPLHYLRIKNLEMSIAEVNPASVLFNDFALKEEAQSSGEASGRVVIFQAFGYLYFLNPADLSLKWRSQERYSVPFTKLARSIHQSRTPKGLPLVFLPSADGKRIIGLDGRDGTPVWQTYLAAEASTDLVFYDGEQEQRLCVGLQNGTIVKIDPLTGAFLESRHGINMRPVDISCESEQYIIVGTLDGRIYAFEAKDLSFIATMRLNTTRVLPPVVLGNRVVALESREFEKRIRLFEIEVSEEYQGLREMANERIDPQVRGTILSAPVPFGNGYFALLSDQGVVYLFAMDETPLGVNVILRARIPLSIAEDRLAADTALVSVASAVPRGGAETAREPASDFLLLDSARLRIIDIDATSLASAGQPANAVIPATIAEYGIKGLFEGQTEWQFQPVVQVLEDGSTLCMPVVDQASKLASLVKVRYRTQADGLELDETTLYAHGKVFQETPLVVGGELVFRDQEDLLFSLELDVSHAKRAFRAQTRELAFQYAGEPLLALEGAGMLLAGKDRLRHLDTADGRESIYVAEEGVSILPYVVYAARDGISLFCTDDRKLHAVRFEAGTGQEVALYNPRLPEDILPSSDDMLGMTSFDTGEVFFVVVAARRGLMVYTLTREEGDAWELQQAWRYISIARLDRLPVLYEEGFVGGGVKTVLLYQAYADGKITVFDLHGLTDGQDNGKSDSGRTDNPTVDIVGQYYTGIAGMSGFGVNNYFLVIAARNNLYLIKRNQDSEIEEMVVQTLGDIDGLLVLEDLVCAADATNRLSFVRVGVNSRLEYRYNIGLERTCDVIPLYLDRRYLLVQTVDGRTYLFDPSAEGDL